MPGRVKILTSRRDSLPLQTGVFWKLGRYLVPFLVPEASSTSHCGAKVWCQGSPRRR